MEHRFQELPPVLSNMLDEILKQRKWLPPDTFALQTLGKLAQEDFHLAKNVLDALSRKTRILKSTSAVIMQEVKFQRQGLSPRGQDSAPRQSPAQSLQNVSGQSVSQQKPSGTVQYQLPNPPSNEDALRRRGPITPEKRSTPPVPLTPPSLARSSGVASSGSKQYIDRQDPQHTVVRRLELQGDTPPAKAPRIDPPPTGGTRHGDRRQSNAGNASLDGWLGDLPASQQSFGFPGLVRFETPPPEEPALGDVPFAGGVFHKQHQIEPVSENRVSRTPSGVPLEDKHVQCVTLSSSSGAAKSPLPPTRSYGLPQPSPLRGTWQLETPENGPPRLVLEAFGQPPVRWEQPLDLLHLPAQLRSLFPGLINAILQPTPQGALQHLMGGSIQGRLWGQAFPLERVDLPLFGALKGPVPPSLQQRGGSRSPLNQTPGKAQTLSLSRVLSAFGELDFKRRWLVEYHGGNQLALLSQVSHEPTLISALRSFQTLSFSEIETQLLSMLPKERHRKRIASLLLQEDQNVVYAVKVRKNRTVELMAPSLEQAGTAGGRLFGYDRLLTVYIEDLAKNRATCEAVLRDGVSVCLRRYSFLLPKDATSKDVRILYLSLSSDALADARNGFDVHASVYDALARVAHFHTCPSVAKFLARLQLAFSKTWTAFDVQEKGAQVFVVDDVPCKDARGNVVLEKGSRKPLIHTDGTGFISEDLAALIPAGISQGCLPQETPSLDRKHHEVPLVTQFRLFHNGEAYKGTVTMNRTLPPKTIVLPESCRKVKRDKGWAKDLPKTLSTFEVCQSSQEPSGEARLNQQLILLLWYGGVPTSTFLRMADEALEGLLSVCNDVTSASKLLLSFCNGEKPKQQVEDGLRMLAAGFDLSDLKLKSLVRSLQKERFVELSKGRIAVKNTYSNLMGIADPTGQLEPDEVMVILPEGARYQTCEKVLVFRQPGLHPGDIRVFKARKVPGVEHLVGTSGYAIIFSVKGERSAPDMMAGGDLDGDPYWVCFNEELCEPFQPSDPAPHLEPSNQTPEPLPTDAEELTAKLREHFLTCTYSIQSAIGTAQRNWLAFADRHSQDEFPVRGKGVGSANCLALNEIYCRALDASKSGDKVSVPRDLIAFQYPDFMGKDKEVRERGGNETAFITYESKSVLGRIYQRVFPHLQEVQAQKPEKVEFDEDLKLDCASENVPASIARATKLLNHYKDAVRTAMKVTDITAREAAVERVKLKYKRELWEHHLPPDEPNLAEAIERLELMQFPPPDVILLARAAYSVTYMEANAAYERQRDCRQALSFPWNIALPVLCKIKRAARMARDPHFISFETDLVTLWTMTRKKSRRAKEPIEIEAADGHVDMD